MECCFGQCQRTIDTGGGGSNGSGGTNQHRKGAHYC